MTCPEAILQALTRPRTGPELWAMLPYHKQVIHRGLLRLRAVGAVQRRGWKYVRVGTYERPTRGQLPAPDGAMAAAKALGISRQAAHAAIKAGRIVYTEEGWMRR